MVMKRKSGIKEKQNQNWKIQPSGISENENIWNVKYKYDYNIVLGIFLFVQCHEFHSEATVHHIVMKNAEQRWNEKFWSLFLNLGCNKLEHLKDHPHFSHLLPIFPYENLKISLLRNSVYSFFELIECMLEENQSFLSGFFHI